MLQRQEEGMLTVNKNILLAVFGLIRWIFPLRHQTLLGFMISTVLPNILFLCQIN
jgi:hypothetical protein